MGQLKSIGILTAGGDCQGLNAAIRGVAKTAIKKYDMEVIGFHDGYAGLIENRYLRLTDRHLSGILTIGGTILGTTRVKPHKVSLGETTVDMTAKVVANYHKLHLDALICIGGGGTQKNALRLMQNTDMNILTLPKTIDNDVSGTDVCFGYDTAVGIATEAIDRLHSTAYSHHRVMLVEVMGHNTGWLTAASGLAGGADVVVIPEIPYDPKSIAKALIERNRSGKRFSIVAIAEGAMSKQEHAAKQAALQKGKKKHKAPLLEDTAVIRLHRHLGELTNLEIRVTSLGHVMRGGSPSSFDRIIASQLGSHAVELVNDGHFGVLVAMRDGKATPIPLEEVAGKRRTIELDDPIITSLQQLGINLGVDKL